jgi:cytoskeleton protein RodZ
MESVASDLKSAREKLNISLAQIAADTKISLHYLECIESGRFGELPGGMYNRAFLRAYCERLNLNQQEVLSRYDAELSPAFDKLAKSKIHIGQKDTSLRISPVVIWSLMLLISATGLFFSRQWIAEVFSPYFSRKPAAINTEIPKAPAPVPATTPSNPASNQPALAPVPAETGATVSADSGAPASPNAPITAPVSEPQGLDSAIPPLKALLRLEIGISEQCWVSVDRDGSPVVRRLMNPGDVQSVNANDQLLLVLGNAGGAHLKINGKPTKPLGRQGEVIKILINEKNLQDLFDQTAG